MAGRKINKLIGALRILIGISLLVFLIYKSDLRSFSTIHEPVKLDILLWSIIILIVSFIVMGLRLHVMVSKISKNFPATFRQFLIGWFFSNILPTNIGGDGYLIYYYKDKAGSVARITAIITFQRIMGIIILLSYGLIFGILNPGFFTGVISKFDISFTDNIIVILLFSFIIMVIAVFLFLFFRSKISTFSRKYLKGLKDISFKEIILTFFLSIIYQLLRLAGFFLLLKAFGQIVDPFSLFFILVFVTLISMLPISVGGLGVQESMFALGLSTFGVAFSIAILVSLINRGIFIVEALTGGILFLFEKKKNRSKKI